jgi:hypothetical protein
MKLETEFNIGQEVCFMKDNALCFGKIKSFNVYCSIVDDELSYRTIYKLFANGTHLEFPELKLFPDKHTLLSTL